MGIRKETYKDAHGQPATRYVADYPDQHGKRHQVRFALRKDADAHRIEAMQQIGNGTFTPASHPTTVAIAADEYLASKSPRIRSSTLATYKSHINVHIVSHIGGLRLAKLTKQTVYKLKDDLIRGHGDIIARASIHLLYSILKDAMKRGNVSQNVAEDIEFDRRNRKRVTIPSAAEVNLLLAKATRRFRPLLITAATTGMRLGELRGLEWARIDLDARRIHICQIANERDKLVARTKTPESLRTIEISARTANMLREWKLQCPRSPHGLAFPSRAGRVWNDSSIARSFRILMRNCSIVDSTGKPAFTFHALRHFHASWLLSTKTMAITDVSRRLGHKHPGITLETYSHAIPGTTHDDEITAADEALFKTLQVV